MVVSATDFKQLQSHLTGGVTIITTHDNEGQPWGFTASSFCSLSLDPPLVLFCLGNSADCYPAFTQSNCFAVNILSAEQSELSQRFARKGREKYTATRFAKGALGLPLIEEALAQLECSVQAIYPGGDHVIVVGQVEGGISREGQPLLYYARSYGVFSPLTPQTNPT